MKKWLSTIPDGKLPTNQSKYWRIWRRRKSGRDVHGSVHRNINLIERTNQMRLCSRIYYSNVFGCRPLRWLSHRSGRQPKTYVKPEAAIRVFEFLMMGGVSPETCWAIKKHWNNKFYYTVASGWFFLWDLKCGHTYVLILCWICLS